MIGEYENKSSLAPLITISAYGAWEGYWAYRDWRSSYCYEKLYGDPEKAKTQQQAQNTYEFLGGTGGRALRAALGGAAASLASGGGAGKGGVVGAAGFAAGIAIGMSQLQECGCENSK